MQKEKKISLIFCRTFLHATELLSVWFKPKGDFFKLIDTVRGALRKNLLPLLDENNDKKFFFP